METAQDMPMSYSDESTIPIINLCNSFTITMDPLFEAMSLFRRRRFEEAAECCSKILAVTPFDQVTLGARNNSPEQLTKQQFRLPGR